MNEEQTKEVKRVCGENFETSDIPTLWRNERKEYMKDKYTPDLEEVEKARIEDELADDYEPEWDSCEGL